MDVYILDRRCKDREQIAKWLREDKAINSVSLFDHYDTLFQKINLRPPSLCLIRVGDPMIACFEATKLIEKNNSDCKIVFISDSKEYAVEAYDVGVYGYLISPINKQKFEKIIREVEG